MECIPDSAHASVIFTSFEVKCSREIILEVRVDIFSTKDKLCTCYGMAMRQVVVRAFPW